MIEAGRTPLQTMQQVRSLLAQAGEEQAMSKARCLMCALYETDMHGLLMATEPLNQPRAQRLADWVRRCLAGEPVQYILGQADFMGLAFTVTPDVLIPRRDSEVLAQWAIEQAPPGARVLDLCTGSGCLAIAVKHARTDVKMTATDISAAALLVAQQNGRRLRTDVTWRQGDGCTPVQGESFDIILCNPPYITVQEMQELEPQVFDFEPHLALCGGTDGLDFYRRWIPVCRRLLEPHGWLGMEIGYAQGAAVSAYMRAAGFERVQILPDMERRDRVVVGYKGEGETDDRPLETD